MSNIKVSQSKCPQDHPCPLMGICPVEAISQDGFSAPKIDADKCISCGRCVITCPYHCLSFE